MKRVVVAVFAAGLILPTAFVGVAGASHSAGEGGGPPNDFVVGAGHHSVPDTQFTLSAHSGPSGEDPKGQVSFKIEGGPRFTADVTCVLIQDNQAIVTAVIRKPDSAAGQVIVMHAVDNGNPNDGSPPDLLRFSFAGAIVESPQNPGCFLPVLPPVPVTQGNIVVHDG